MQQNHKIGRYNITLQPLTWWQSEEVKAVIATGARMNSTGLSGFEGNALLESKLKLFESTIKEIKEVDKEIPYSNEWVKQLTHEEGEALEKAIDDLSKKK